MFQLFFTLLLSPGLLQYYSQVVSILAETITDMWNSVTSSGLDGFGAYVA